MISGAALYKWKAKYSGLEVTEAKRLRTLEGEAAGQTNNGRLKKLLRINLIPKRGILWIDLAGALAGC